MLDLLAGKKAIFLWNWPRADSAAPTAIADDCARAGVQVVLIKTHDGGRWYDQGQSFRRLRWQLKRSGVPLVGAWGYFYFDDPDGERARVRESIRYGRADCYVYNIEDNAVETNPLTPYLATTLFGEVREASPDYPLYFCSHAQPRYHERQPYWEATQADVALMPMAYHTAMQVSPERSVQLAFDGIRAYELDTVPVNLAGAAYGTQEHPLLAEDIFTWANAAIAAGATGLTWWSYDVARNRPDILDAIGAITVPWPAG